MCVGTCAVPNSPAKGIASGLQASWVVNCQTHDIPALMSARLLNPLGRRGVVLANAEGFSRNPALRSALPTLPLKSDGFPRPPETLTGSTIEPWEMAEGVGFEPTMPCGIPVFKTGAFDHSATPPDGSDTGPWKIGGFYGEINHGLYGRLS